jgi:hypothetical protein
MAGRAARHVRIQRPTLDGGQDKIEGSAADFGQTMSSMLLTDQFFLQNQFNIAVQIS